MAPLLKLVAVPHKVMAEHGHSAATACFAVAQSHRVAARLAEAVADKRAPVLLRARCADYLRGALADWSDDALAKEPEVFEAAIAAGSVDASPDVRAWWRAGGLLPQRPGKGWWRAAGGAAPPAAGRGVR